MSSKKNAAFLVNAPLKEVLFELRWNLDYIPSQRIFDDPGFDEAAMAFTNSCQQDFKKAIILKPPSIPITALAYQVTHRFFKGAEKYPLYQLGPGVFTVNDNNKNYKWRDFNKLIGSGTSCLRNSFDRELVINRVELRYIDSVDINCLGDTDKFEFLHKHLNISIEPYKFVDGNLKGIRVDRTFEVGDQLNLNLSIATGVDMDTTEEIAIWHTFVNNRVPLTWDSLNAWIESAHDLCSQTFKKMTSQKLYEYFNTKV
ncbi:MAG: TIGR04255 family protein [Saprospiraceae bacterium]|nr:TIGR04255 family protein [Saprospiraceae bacterium]